MIVTKDKRSFPNNKVAFGLLSADPDFWRFLLERQTIDCEGSPSQSAAFISKKYNYLENSHQILINKLTFHSIKQLRSDDRSVSFTFVKENRSI